MDRRRRLDLVATACLVILGALLLGSAIVMLAPGVPALIGGSPHEAGDVTMLVMIVLGPLATAGLLTMVPALLLGFRVPGGRIVAMLWAFLAGLALAALYRITGGDLWTPFHWLLPAVAVGALTVACCLLAGWIVGRRQSTHPLTGASSGMR